MAAGAKLGIKCVAYYNTGTYGTPVWTAITCINDFTQSVEWDEAEVLYRGTRVKQAVKTLLGLSWSGKLKVSDTDTAYQAIMAALVSDSTLDMMILNGDKTTNNVIGYRCDVQVFSATEDQGTGVVLYDEVKFKPSPMGGNAPSSVLVTTGAPVFTALSF